MRLWLALLAAAPVLSCGSHRSDEGPPETPALVPGAVAACAGTVVFPAEVSRVAAATSSSKARAVSMIADDARLARRAHDRGLDRTAAVAMEVRAVLARAVLHDLRDSNAAPFTAQEIDRVRQDHRADFDSPESIRVIHAVARATASDPQDKRDRASDVARAIAAVTAGAHGAAEFRTRAGTVAHEGLEVVIEELPPIDFAGRSLDGSLALEGAFAAGAARLSRPDDEVVTATSFGTHVIHLLDRKPPHHATDEEILSVAGEELLANRGRDALGKLLESARGRDRVELERSAEDTLRALDARSP